MVLVAPCRKGDVAPVLGPPLPQEGVNGGFCISGPPTAEVALWERQPQPGFALEGLGAETTLAGDSCSLKGGSPLYLLAHLLLGQRPAPVWASLKPRTKAANTSLLS